MKTKICKVCESIEIYTGRYCKPCWNAHLRGKYAKQTEAQREHRRAYQREYHKKNYEADPEYYKKRFLDYYNKDKEKALSKARIANRKWRAANKEKLYELVKAWKKRNPEKIREYSRIDYERKKLKKTT